ncbi:MAG: hypothetical protein Q9163_005565 [Psora crenata]
MAQDRKLCTTVTLRVSESLCVGGTKYEPMVKFLYDEYLVSGITRTQLCQTSRYGSASWAVPMRRAAVQAFRTARRNSFRKLLITRVSPLSTTHPFLNAGPYLATLRKDVPIQVVQSSMYFRNFSLAAFVSVVASGVWYYQRDHLQESRAFVNSTSVGITRSEPQGSQYSTLAGPLNTPEKKESTHVEPLAEGAKPPMAVDDENFYLANLAQDAPLTKHGDQDEFNRMEKLTPEQATQKLRRMEQSYTVGRGRGVVRYDLVQIPSNNPIEDDHAEKIIEIPQTVTNGAGSSDWMFWGVFDGHSGWTTSARLRQVLISYVARELHNTYKTALADPSLALPTPQSIDAAIKRGFLRLDNDIVHTSVQKAISNKTKLAATELLAPALSGSCALLSFYDSSSKLLRVACTGDSRAVLGRKGPTGKWTAIPLSEDQTGGTPSEAARLRAEHPNEPDVTLHGRIMGGLEPSRAFGDATYKWARDLQEQVRGRFFSRSPPSRLKTPPYVTAEPVVTTTKVEPEKGDFVVLATDGLWEMLTNEEVVGLVGRWIEKQESTSSVSSPWAWAKSLAGNADKSLPVEKSPLWSSKDGGGQRTPLRQQQWSVKESDERFVVEDKNVATHLVRNALGGRDRDLIRTKRLAKLGNQAPTQINATGESASNHATGSQTVRSDPPNATSPQATGHPQETPKINIASSPTPSSKENPFPQLGMKQPNDEVPTISITPQRRVAPQERERSSSNARPSSRAGETLEQWEDRTLRNIFRVTLGPGEKHDSHGHPLHYLEGTRAELEESGQQLRLSTTLLDQALLEATSDPGKHSNPLQYLLACWKRVSRQFRALKKYGDEDPKFKIAKEARRLCMSYCIFAVTMPDMFDWEPPERNPLTPHLLTDPEGDLGIDHDFLTEAVLRFAEDDTIQSALVGAVEDLSRQLAKMSMNDDYKPYITALRSLVQYPPIVHGIVASPLFLPSSIPAGTLEAATLLGPFFAISPLQGDVTTNYFSAPSTRDKGYIINSQRALRMTLQSHQNDLMDIVNKVIKTGKEPREKMLNWFARCCNINHKRRALQVDKKLVSSDGFMINVTVCLDRLCEPFMDASFSKIDRIDVNYLRRNPRVDIREETKLNADQNASDTFYSKPAEGTNNFISEVFFLTLAAHHYGIEAATSTMSQLDKDLKRMKKHLEEVELDRHKFVNDPNQLQHFERAIQKWKDQIEKGMSYKYSVEGVLLDDLTQARSMQFMRYVIVWLLRLGSPRHDFPDKPLDLPLPEEQPEVFKCLPEYFLEDVVSNFKFIMRNMPQIITPTQSEELVMLCITFLRSSEYIKNPYLKSGLVTIMFQGIWPTYNRSKGVLGDLLLALPLANEHLLHSLIKFYIEVETTGAHTQFYDKFNIRYEIFQIIKCIWSSPIYREHLSEEAAKNVEFFVRFVNLLLNDVTFVLDESLTAFVQIHNLSQELKHFSLTMEQNLRTEKEEALAAAQGKAKSYMQLTNETVAMLKLFTEALASSFTMPEIVQRLADMLDYNLDVMVGPKSRDLVVDNPQEYGFQPRTLLSEIVDVYLNLKDKENFVFAVARDGRSYKPFNFEQATTILKKWGLKSGQDLSAWASLGEKFKKAKEVDEQAEEDLGEIPDEFLDPLMYTLMTDPVILPTSKTSIDRSTIRSHLLSDPNDPFNRAPLKIEEVIPDTELLAKINAFKAEKNGRRIRDSNVMDETPG